MLCLFFLIYILVQRNCIFFFHGNLDLVSWFTAAVFPATVIKKHFSFLKRVSPLSGSHNTPSLWAGTNGGCVFAYMLRIPSMEHRAEEGVTAQPGGCRVRRRKEFGWRVWPDHRSALNWELPLVSSSPQAKEIQLMHRAPVVGIVVLDGHGAPLPEPLEVAHDLARSPDMQGSHHLLVVSEEQFKVSPLHSSGGGLQVHNQCICSFSHVKGYYAILNMWYNYIFILEKGFWTACALVISRKIGLKSQRSFHFIASSSELDVSARSHPCIISKLAQESWFLILLYWQ